MRELLLRFYMGLAPGDPGSAEEFYAKLRKAPDRHSNSGFISKKGNILTDANGGHSDVCWVLLAIAHERTAERSFVKVPANKEWLNANCDKAQGAGGALWLKKDLPRALGKLLRRGLIGEDRAAVFGKARSITSHCLTEKGEKLLMTFPAEAQQAKAQAE